MYYLFFVLISGFGLLSFQGSGVLWVSWFRFSVISNDYYFLKILIFVGLRGWPFGDGPMDMDLWTWPFGDGDVGIL